MKYKSWSFVEAKGAPEWLQYRQQTKGVVYRIYYVKLGFDIRHVIRGQYDHWKEAAFAGEEVFSEIKKQSKMKPGIAGKLPHEILCSDIAAEILKDKDRNGLRDSTYDHAELFYRRHIIPFLGGYVERDSKRGAQIVYVQGECPKAMDLTPLVWKKYVDQFRAKSPGSPLFNHWKFFVTLFRYTKENRLIDQFYRLDYSEKRDDNREEGMIVSNEDLPKMIFRAATRNWRNRIIIQRWTGGRPGEVRNLRKGPITKTLQGRKQELPPNVWLQGSKILIRYYEFDTKNKKEREFYIESELVTRAILDQVERYPDSPYLFPNERDRSKPMDKCLNGWKSTLKRAGVDPNLTPHDLRHTYLTDMFKTSNEWAIICYQAGLSLEEAQKTYLHIGAEDTQELARLIAQKAQIGNIA